MTIRSVFGRAGSGAFPPTARRVLLATTALTSAALLAGAIAATPALAVDTTWDTAPGNAAEGAGDSSVTGGAGTWDEGTTANWTEDGGANNIFWSSSTDGNAVFSTGSGTVSVDAAGVTGVNSIQFNSAGYTIGGTGTVTLGSTASLGGTQNGAISTVLAGGGTSVTKVNSNTITLTGTNTYAGSTQVNGGTLNVTGANGSIASTTIGVDGGSSTLHTDGGALASGATVTLTNGGTFDITGNETITSLVVTNGTVDVHQQTLTATTSTSLAAGNLSSTGGAGIIKTGTYTQSGGTVDANVTVQASSFSFTNTGAATVNGVLADNGGAAGLTQSGSGTTTLTGTNTYTGSTQVNAGELDITGANGKIASTTIGVDGGSSTLHTDGGALASGATVTLTNGGTFDITGNETITSLVVTNGTVDVHQQTLTATTSTSLAAGNLSSTGGAGIIKTGTYTQSGGTVDANVTVQASSFSFTNTGAATVNGVLADNGGAAAVTQSGSGTTTFAGINTYTGGTTISNGELALSGSGTLGATTNTTGISNGTLDLGGTTQTQAALNQSGGTVQNGQIDVGTYQLTGGTLASDATVDASATFDMQAGTVNGTLTGTGFVNKTTGGTVTFSAPTPGANNYTGATILTAGILQGGAADSFSHTSVVSIFGAGTFNLGGFNQTIGFLTNNGGTIDMHSAGTPAPGDVLTVVTGNASDTNGTVNLDIDLSNGTVDKIAVNGSYAPSGTTFNFSTNGTSSALWATPDQVIVSTTGGLVTPTYMANGLPPAGVFTYSLTDDGTNIYVHQQANLALLGGIAGNITAVQSTLATVVNRPTSPFTSGLAADVPAGYCGAGPWARGTGGQATTTTMTSVVGQNFAADSTVDIGYVGAQAGLDLSCFNVNNSGVDVAFGAIAGYNQGSTTQKIDDPMSTTDGTFAQSFAGLYATVASKNGFFADLQARGDFTDFGFTNSDSSVGLDDAKLSTQRYSISGSASITIAAGDYNLYPTAGFSVSRTHSSALHFASGETLTPQDFDGEVGFVGATINRIFILPEGTTAIVPFATATIYNDFAPDPTAVFADTDPLTPDQTMVSQNLGTYGEASLGVNFVNLLDSSSGGPKQFNAGIRADVKYSDRLQGVGVTAQARAQF